MVGQVALRQASLNPEKTLYSVKRFIGRRFSEVSDETTIKISPDQAVLGCQIPVPTMDGEVIITVPPMLHNGQKLRLRSKGWPDKNGNRSDEYVIITIDIPHLLSPAEREIYQRLAEQKREVHKQ